MAEFKLGRIRFVWKNQWVADTVYYQDDVVAFGGKTYICVIGHTSQTDFFSDLDIVPPKWNLVSEGQNWKGDWTPDTEYVYDDIVSYGARLYICNTNHTSAATVVDVTDGLEADLAKWDAYAEGLDWQGDWQTSYRYRINDFVKYGGATYVCNTLHVSAATAADGLEEDIDNWDIFNQGIEYKGAWVANTRYKINDLVRYGAGIWIASSAHTSSSTFGTDSANWTKFVEGFQYENDWSPFRAYQPGDVVRYGGNQYLATTSNTAVIPTSSEDDWEIFTEGFRFIGDWNEDSANQHYKVGEVVRLGGFTYVCVQDHETAQQPPNADYWNRINEGFRWRGEWLDDQEYYEGDVVRYGDNTYYCNLYHISEGDDFSTETLTEPGGGAQGSRPDLEDSGQYWSIIAVGSEQSVLTTTGDLVYFTGDAPTRLPIGKEGQILQVSSNGIPEWEFLQSVDDIYYVAEHGVDRPYPESGSNIDRPFKTIRYACEQIEKGPKNPNSQYLLDLNRVFIQEEVGSYINYQIANADPGSIWENFEYGEDKCKRDVGIILDKIKWDLGHGGNLKTRSATQSLLGVLGEGPFSDASEQEGSGYYPGLGDEADVSVDAYNYMLSLIQNVLNNEAPDTIYQNVADDSTAIVDQFISETIEAEPGSYTRLAELVGIVTTAIASQDSSDIPDRVVPQTLVKVSTGKHYETLPIIVPAYCAILGDELRSTQIFASSATVPASDNEYTIKTFDRISDIVGDIVIGTPITPTTGNNEAQTTDWPNAITAQSTIVTDLVDLMKYKIDYDLNTMLSTSLSSPATFIGTTKEIARENLIANRNFIIAEVIAFLEDQYSDLKYSKTDTRRDSRYVLDALEYDLTYGGNSLSVITGRAYWDGDDDDESQIPASIKAATIASLNYLKTTAQNVAGNTTIVNPYQTAEPQVITGNTGSITEIADLVEDIIDILDNGVAAIGDTTTLTNVTLTNADNTTTALISAFNALDTATSSIQSDTISWINTEYPDLTYNSTKCSRDIGLILEAISYDFALNTSFRTLKAAHSYLRGTATEVYTLNQKAVTRAAIEYALLDSTDGAVANVGSDPIAIKRIQESARIIDAVIYSGSNEGSVCQTNDQNAYYAMLQLERNREFIKSEVSAWINYNYVNFDNFYNSTTCERDVGYIIDAVCYDLITGSNFASSVAGAAYYRAVTSAEAVVNDQLVQTISAIKEARRLTINSVTDSSLYDEVASAFNNVLNILQDGVDAVPTYTFPDNGTTTADDSTTAGTFQTNRATIISDVSSYLNTNYNAQWTALGAEGQATCQRDLGYIIDAATYDVAYGGNYQSVIAGDSYYSYGTLQIGAGDEKTATLAALTQLKAELVADAEASSQAAVGNNMDDVIAIVTNGAGTVATTYPSETGETATIQATFTAIQTDIEVITPAVTTFITNEFSSYTYNETLCLRDVDTYIDALKFDLMYPGNYKSRYVARYYTNAVTGSQEEDMFYLRDATGVRNCTLNGLNGDLTPPNIYGTSRCTAGSYCSLDPGWGPDDFTTWIITRSPYVQGVTTFGNAATGQKIDGALHNGGNDSIVSNDFTQVISDGIGAHILNNGRAELVSVFTYYSHIGYLAETGGRIRATNGNNSYGDFGSVAEGVDPDETPITAIVDNRTQYNATISNVITDNSAILAFEYNHAGNDYTEVEYNIFGPGADELIVADEFRNSGVNYVLVDQDADPDIQIGGSGYVVVSNTAQSGSTTGIFLAATDGALSSAYPGMKIYIIGGAGVGQYGIVDTYDAGSKEVEVIKESDGTPGWEHVVPGTPIVAPNSSSTYQIEPRVEFVAPAPVNLTAINAGATLGDQIIEDIHQTITSGQYLGLDRTVFGITPQQTGNGEGATFDITRNGSKYYVELATAGTGYERLDQICIAGSELGGSGIGLVANPGTNDLLITVTSVNSVTGAIVDFDFTGAGSIGPVYLIGRDAIGAVSTNEVLSISGDSQFGLTTDNNFPTIGSSGWLRMASGLLDDGSSLYKPSAIVAIGYDDVAYTDDPDNGWSSTPFPAALGGGRKDIAFGNVIGSFTNRFVVISVSDTDVVYSDNGGATWSVATGALSGTGFQAITYGQGKWVAVTNNSTAAAYSDDGITWTTVTAPGTFQTNPDVVYGNGKFVALGGTTGTMYSLDGVTWYESPNALPRLATSNAQRIAYGQGTFAITCDEVDGFNTFIQYSRDGLVWNTHTISRSGANGHYGIGLVEVNNAFTWLSTGIDSGDFGRRFQIGTPAKGRASVSNEQIFEIRITEPGSGYLSPPAVTITDPNNIQDVVLVSQLGNDVLANPSFVNRGTGFTTASAEVDGDNSNGNAEFPQNGTFIAVRRMTERPVNGSNVEFDSLPGEFYKLVNTVSFLGQNDGSYTGFLQISPEITVEDTLPDNDPVEMRIRFSQVRLTGHDFLDIGTGNFTTTNYPGVPLNLPNQERETQEDNGGRVFYTATDQDGNFRVGDLFTIEQSTGVATLNADAFNIAGLQELSLGEVTLGGNSATVSEFSTDPFFTANSDTVIPTQRAVKAYIEAQIGGGGASLNVNSVTAGDIFIGSDTITTLSGNTINIKANIVFSGSVLGLPLAYNYFLR